MSGFAFAEYEDVFEAHGKRFHLARGEKRQDALWLGVELELESVDEDQDGATAQLNESIGDFVIVKSDGSLPCRSGIEINSLPATLKWHSTAWDGFFADADDYLQATSRCGMHVHIDYKKLGGRPALARLWGLVTARENYQFITALAGRGSGEYRDYYSDPDDVTTAEAKLRRIEAHDPPGSALRDMSLYHGTAELRIFASTTRRDKFLRRLEFADAAARFVRGDHPVETADPALHYRRFIAWCQRPYGAAQYPHLNAWLQANNYITVQAATQRELELA